MKKIFITLFSLLISASTFAIIDTIKAKSKITDVTVFFSGAQITRELDLKAMKGKHLLIINQLPMEINEQSVQIKALPGCKILSVKHQVNQQNGNKKSAEERAIEDKIDAQKLRIKEIKNRLEVFELEEKLLLDNSHLEKKEGTGATVATIKEAADYYRLRLNEVRQGKLNLFTDLDNSNKKIQELYVELNEKASVRKKAYSQVLVTLECEKDIASDLYLTYYIASAGWEPLYDFRVEDISKPLTITYNANVYQSSGEDWNNVKIKLSNSNPSLSGDKPELEPWYLGRYYAQKQNAVQQAPAAIKGRVIDARTGDGLPGAIVSLYRGSELIKGVQSNMDGEYAIKPLEQGYYDLKVNYIGYNDYYANVYLNSGNVTMQDCYLSASEVALQEVVVQAGFGSGAGAPAPTMVSELSMMKKDKSKLNIRGARSAEEAYFVDGQKVIGGADNQMEIINNIANSLSTNVANLEYAIEMPYSVPSDGADYSIKIKDVNIPVSYIYSVVPKLDNDVFLTAEMKDWAQLNLLSGKSSIYYQGTFVAESFIDANQTKDTLSISLGRDKNILVKREANKKMIEKKIIAGTVKETSAWEITVRNNKTSAIKVTVEDQYPLSERKSVEVELLESLGAKVDSKTGKLTWDLSVEPNDKKIVSFKYSVKYPKDVNLLVE